MQWKRHPLSEVVGGCNSLYRAVRLFQIVGVILVVVPTQEHALNTVLNLKPTEFVLRHQGKVIVHEWLVGAMGSGKRNDAP